MTTIFDVYSFIRQLTDKAGTGFLDPVQVSNWLEAAQLSVFNTYRANGALDNITQGGISPFVVQPTAFTSDSSGLFSKPANYVQSLRIVNSAGKEHTPILFNEIRDALISGLDPIDEYPRYMESGSYMALYPQAVTTGTISYYRLPVAPFIGTDPNSDGSDVVYNAGTSIQLELPKAYWVEVILKTLPYVGVNLSDAQLVSLTQSLS